MDNKLFNALIITLIIGIVITLSFNLYMRSKIIEDEAFSLIYFNEHEILPEKVSEQVNVSVIVGSYELNTSKFVLKAGNFKKEMVLDPGEFRKVQIISDPTDADIKIIISSNDNSLYEPGVFGTRSNITTERYPLSFGSYYHVNLSVSDLPFERHLENVSNKNNIKQITKEDLKIYKNKNMVNVERVYNEEIKIFLRRPFVIKFYKYGESIEDVLDIYFWYELV